MINKVKTEIEKLDADKIAFLSELFDTCSERIASDFKEELCTTGLSLTMPAIAQLMKNIHVILSTVSGTDLTVLKDKHDTTRKSLDGLIDVSLSELKMIIKDIMTKRAPTTGFFYTIQDIRKRQEELLLEKDEDFVEDTTTIFDE